MGSVESFSSISLHQCTSARPLRFATTHARQNIMFVHSRMHTYSSIVSKEGTHTEAKREVLSLFLSLFSPTRSLHFVSLRSYYYLRRNTNVHDCATSFISRLPARAVAKSTDRFFICTLRRSINADLMRSLNLIISRQSWWRLDCD